MGINNQVLGAWTAEWVLTDRGISCAKCQRVQPITDAESAFEHEAGCEANLPQWRAQGAPHEHDVEPDQLMVQKSLSVSG